MTGSEKLLGVNECLKQKAAAWWVSEKALARKRIANAVQMELSLADFSVTIYIIIILMPSRKICDSYEGLAN